MINNIEDMLDVSVSLVIATQDLVYTQSLLTNRIVSKVKQESVCHVMTTKSEHFSLDCKNQIWSALHQLP